MDAGRRLLGDAANARGRLGKPVRISGEGLKDCDMQRLFLGREVAQAHQLLKAVQAINAFKAPVGLKGLFAG